MVKLFFLRRLLGLAYVLDGVLIFFGYRGKGFSLKTAIKVSRQSFAAAKVKF